MALDDRTTDKTAKLARKHGAEIHRFQMCETHTCPQHGTIQAQHFARARNFSFAHRDPSLAWTGWLDADDVMQRADLLPALCRTTPEDAIGVWFEYLYAYARRADGGIVPTTTFHRERVFRTRQHEAPVTWDWQYRVHEVCAPTLPGGQQPRWLINDEIKILHQDGAHKSESSAARNLTLLEIDYEENPTDSRTLFYIGNQYFAQGQWLQATFWYEKLLETGQNVYENWQAQVYGCKAYQRQGLLEHALRLAYGALHTEPTHPEGFWCLAEVYSLMSEDKKVVFWTRAARALEESKLIVKPPFFVFVNPLEKIYNQRLPIADSLARMGELSEAKHELQEAYKVLQDERIAGVIKGLGEQEQDQQTADAFVHLAQVTRSPEAILAAYAALPDGVKAKGEVRDLAIPIMVAGRAQGGNGVAA